MSRDMSWKQFWVALAVSALYCYLWYNGNEAAVIFAMTFVLCTLAFRQMKQMKI